MDGDGRSNPRTTVRLSCLMLKCILVLSLDSRILLFIKANQAPKHGASKHIGISPRLELSYCSKAQGGAGPSLDQIDLKRRFGSTIRRCYLNNFLN